MQKRLSEVFKELDIKGCKVMLSNHDTPLIRELYERFRMEKVKAKRAINSK
jgi:DNA adenine methylase